MGMSLTPYFLWPSVAPKIVLLLFFDQRKFQTKITITWTFPYISSLPRYPNFRWITKKDNDNVCSRETNLTNFSLQSGIQSRTIIYLNVSCLNSTQNQVLKWLYNFRCRLRSTLWTNLNKYLVILKRTKLTFLFLLLYSGQQYHSFFPYVRRLESNSNEKGS